MSYDISRDDEFGDSTDDDVKNQFTIQDSIVFLLDGTKQMYESNSIRKCLKAYYEVVRGKCSYNKRDKLGLILFGTKDTNCQIDNVTLLQKFEPCNIDALKNIQNIVNDGIDKYEEQALDSDDKYPLYDAMEYAFQTANSSKTNTGSQKIIILCTSKGDPPKDEQRRVEHLVATFKDTNTKLRVIGLTDSYDDSVFYKELQILSGSYSDDNYRPMSLKDLENNILYLARSIGKMPWKISLDIVVPITLLNLVSTPKYPSKAKLDKKTNEILESRAVLREETDMLDDMLDDSEAPRGPGTRVVTNDKLLYYKTFGAENIHFKPEEKIKLKNAGLESGIEVLAFKPVLCEPLYHCKNTYFVTTSKDANEESRNFFQAFVSRCIAKKVMPICKVITRNGIVVCNMIPSDDDGGFYMYKVPFNNYVRDFDILLQNYVYNEENQCPINNDAFYMFKKLTKDMEIELDLKKFSNPKLEKIIAHLEALALENELNSLPPDSTRPPPLSEKMTRVKTALMNLLELRDIESAKKRPLSQKAGASKKAKTDVDIPKLARENKLNSATVVELKAYLESVGIAPKGTKSSLMEAVKEHLGL